MTVVEGELTPERQQYIKHAYRLFCITKLTSINQFFFVHRVLQDGTRIRITSFADQDEVHVWATDGRDGDKLPHGFVVVIADQAPRLYNFGKTAEGFRWWVGGIAPQIEKGANTYSQTLRRRPEGVPAGDMVLPLVSSNGGQRVWDYWLHAGPEKKRSGAIPFAIDRGKGGKDPLQLHDPHFATSSIVFSRDKDELYKHEPAPSAVLGMGGVGQGDPPVFLSPSVDGQGKLLHLSSIRIGVLAPSVDLYALSPRTEVLRCTGTGLDAKYFQKEKIGEFFTMKPVDSDVEPTLDETLDNLEEDASGILAFIQLGSTRLTRVTGTMWSSGYVNEKSQYIPTDGLYGEAWYGMGFKNIDIKDAVVLTGKAFTTKRKTAVEEKRYKILGVGDEDGTFSMEYVTRLDYPDDIYWRGGQSRWTYDASHPSLPRDERFSIDGYTIGRANSDRSQNGRPEAFFTSWDADELKIFFGHFESEMAGHFYWDRSSTTYAGTLLHPNSGAHMFSSADYSPTSGETNFNVEGWATAMGSDMRDAMQALLDQHGVRLFNEQWLPIHQELGYTLSARHVLDYDHRARFWSAVEVEIQCSGYRAEHPGGDFAKHVCVVVSDPTYKIVFNFVAAWFDPRTNSVLRTKKILKTFSGMEKPLFEAPITLMVDPYNWPSENSVEYANMTTIAPPASVMMMMENISRGQGLNTNFVGENKYDAGGPDFISEKGVEYSHFRNGREHPHEKRSRGMLYARDISLSDLSHLSWLLSATTCDAPLHNNWRMPDAKAWYYMPEVGEFFNSTEKWHIEMRDGVLADWSSEFKDAPNNKLFRNIKLYQT